MWFLKSRFACIKKQKTFRNSIGLEFKEWSKFVCKIVKKKLSYQNLKWWTPSLCHYRFFRRRYPSHLFWVWQTSNSSPDQINLTKFFHSFFAFFFFFNADFSFLNSSGENVVENFRQIAKFSLCKSFPVKIFVKTPIWVGFLSLKLNLGTLLKVRASHMGQIQ